MFSDETKTFDDVQRVVDAGKPAAVVERFAEMYLKSLDPRRPIVAEWQPVQDAIDRFQRIMETISYMDEEGNEIVTKQGRTLTEHEQSLYDAAIAKRDRLENGFTTPAVLDDEGSVVEPEFFTEGNAWLATIRGEGVEPIPDFTPMDTQDFIAQSLPEYRKRNRDAAVAEIVVTTTSGKSFDGDERSQDRMARAVALGEPGMTTQWKLADNTIATVTWEELKEALYLAGQEQTTIWMS